ncbi:MAG: methyl-accepting chemotaxis protein, partial [Candidatus Poribacteria bacterium]
GAGFVIVQISKIGDDLKIQVNEAEIIAGKVQQLRGQVNKEAKDLLTEIENFTKASAVKIERRRQNTMKITLILSIFCLGTGFGLGIFIIRSITHPLNKTVELAEQIAVGDLTANVLFDNRRDELGVLLQAFTRMTQFFKETAAITGQIAAGDLTVEAKPRSERDIMGKALAGMLENLREQIQEMAKGVNILTASTSEISTSLTQFASSATETATAVSETTTTVEEVRQTAQVSSEKAKDVSDNAQQVAQISQIGVKSTEDTIEEINRIKEQMESIADSVVSLSEQSQAIGEIIATVDDLTEQSNLLAVNASIEAAKAGEQGKGFAVVAEEIKSLAEQSKQATAQVRTILNDIQKATGAAVMVTEQGSKAVEAGVKQSIETGEYIRKLADSASQSAQAAAQIAASSQQQLIGMEQVTSAMENIKQGSAQNVEGAKQLETESQNLGELGKRLQQLIQRYKI